MMSDDDEPPELVSRLGTDEDSDSDSDDDESVDDGGVITEV